MENSKNILVESKDEEIRKIVDVLLTDFYSNYNFNLFASVKESFENEGDLAHIDLMILDHNHINHLEPWIEIVQGTPECKIIFIFRGKDEYVAKSLESLKGLNFPNEIDYLIADNYSTQLKVLFLKDLIFKIL